MKITKWDDDRITFDDGSYISYDHEQDCCEYNYADFSVLDVMLGSNKDYVEFDSFEIVAVDDGGFLIKLRLADSRVLYGPYYNIFIPCYSVQNGYYSSDLVIRYYDKYGGEICNWCLYAQLKLD